MKNFIVFDLEWNQSPEGKENSIEHLPFEIIEIGAVKMDEHFQMVSTFHRLITPQVYTQLHYKISEVTHLNLQKLEEEGDLFSVVIRDFVDWCGEECRFCTWGSMDLTELQRNVEYFHLKNPFEKPLYYYDVQKLYALWQGNIRDKQSLDHAVEALGIQQSRPFHRALDDAWYTGRVLQELDWKICSPYLSVDYYRVPENRKEEIYIEFPTYAKYVSRTFPTKEEALEDKVVTDLLCRDCRRMLRKKLRWFSLNQKQYFSLGFCPVHGYVRGKIRVKKAENGDFYVVKTLKHVDEAGAEAIYRKKEDQRQKHHERNQIKKGRRQEKKAEVREP